MNHYYDYHVHSCISADSEATLEEQTAQAARLGLKEICFTEHLEINFPIKGDWQINVKNYIEEYRIAQNTHGVRVKLGVEAGISCSPKDMPTLEGELRSAPLDFVLASCHLVERVDPYEPRFFEGKTIQQAFSGFIQALNTNLRLLDPALFCSVAHIDYPTKGPAPYPDPRLKYEYAPDELDELFRYIIAQGKCLEINTSVYRKLGSLPIPGFDWLKRYVELGGEAVTIGSDSHIPAHLANRLDDAAELAASAGVKYFATFEQMKPIYHKLLN